MITIEELEKELGIDREDVVEFVSVFLDYTENEDLPGLLDGINRGDALVVKRRAHSIKGAALNLMLPEVSSLAEEMEKKAGEGNLDNSPALYASILDAMKLVKQNLV
jgi:HPt (histidine-containing phosphotransfer) domain-containing protein